MPQQHVQPQTPQPSASLAAMLCLALWALLALPPPTTLAQNGFERDVLYTRSAGSATLRKVNVKYELSPSPTLTLGPVIDLGSPAGAGGLCIAPDGDVLVAGGGTAANALHKFRIATGAVQTVSPGAGSPIATQVALDPAGDKVWAVCTVAGTGRIARVPLAPFSQGVAHTITGPDTVLAHVSFGHGRTYYVSTGASPGIGALGTIDLSTYVTTRLLSGLDRPRSVTLDPYTGHLIVFGVNSITQIDARPGSAPIIISSISLAALVPGIDLLSGTVDGLGHAIALSATGHLVLLDYAATREVGHGANTRLAAVLDAAGSLSAIVPLVGFGALRDGGCLWDNGPFDLRDGLPSHNSWMTGDTRTADDFYLCPGIHRIDSISATMFSDSLFLTGLIELYEDCDGTPGALVGSFAANVTDTGTTFQTLRVLSLNAPTPGIWLRGGRSYWVAAVGVGSLDGSDNWYWGTSGAAAPDAPPGTPNTVRGKPAVFRAPNQGLPEWTPSDQAGCGCSDFSFAVRGESCKVLHDNGAAQPMNDLDLAGAPSIISATSTDSRGADNFRVPPCREFGGERICFIEATIYTNCSPVRGLVEILANDCTLPVGPALHSGPFSKVIDLGYNVSLNGAVLRAYTVQVHDPGWFLPEGRNYWLSVAVQGSGGFSQRAYFAANAGRCDRVDCAIHIDQSAVRGSGGPPAAWAPIENSLQVPRDLSFVVAVAQRQVVGGSGGGPAPVETCPADAERDGDVDVADIFSFLSNWFQGCP